MLLGLKEQGWDIREDLVCAATSFGGGVALSKNICGCLSASAIAVGLKYGSVEPTGTAPRPAYSRTKAVLDRFQRRFGTTQCGDLTRPWANDFANRERVHRCTELVRFTLEQLVEVLGQQTESVDWEEPWWDDYLNRRDKIQ
ncbi:MAG: C_GCAxxG_C_C family protein [Chloroflexi bacterium]|nr:C_GCAxxG_C_C family protein [Chloroflexota bacterium]